VQQHIGTKLTVYGGVVRSPPPPPQQLTASVSTEDVDAAGRDAGTSGLVPAPILWTAATVLGVAALLVLLTWNLLTDASHLSGDFPADAWMMTHQAEALRHGTFPSLTLTSPYAAFYPVYAFYGGTLFAFGGIFTLVTGSAYAAQTIVYLLALGAAYGGWLWLARMAGLRSWQAHVPAILYLTAPYVVTNIGVRQDLAEVMATSMIPPMVAATLSILRADRLHAAPAAALAASTMFFVGTHNLTLLWGTTILAVGVALVAIGVPQARSLVSGRGTLRVLAIVVPAIAVNAWYLLPDLAYHADTVIANRIDEWQALLTEPHPDLAAQHLLGLRDRTGLPESGLSTTLPVLAVVWVAMAALVSRASWRGTWARMLAVLTLLTAAALTLMVNPRWILSLPDPWTMIQYSYRLETFVLFGICGAVIAVLRLLDQDAHRWLIRLLLPILLLSVINVALQLHDAPRADVPATKSIDQATAFTIGDYADATLRQIPAKPKQPSLRITRANLQRGVMTGDLRADPGALIYTSLLTPSRMLHIDGAHIVGRWSAPWFSDWQKRWGLVLKINEDATPGKAHIVIREARTLPIVSGQIISIFGLLGLVANAAVIARAGWLRRRAR
jgi:hypothetical protein